MKFSTLSLTAILALFSYALAAPSPQQLSGREAALPVVGRSPEECVGPLTFTDITIPRMCRFYFQIYKYINLIYGCVYRLQ